MLTARFHVLKRALPFLIPPWLELHALSLVVGSSACSMTTFRVPACLAKGKRELETLYKRLIGHSSIIGALVICGHSGAALKQVATMCLL